MSSPTQTTKNDSAVEAAGTATTTTTTTVATAVVGATKNVEEPTDGAELENAPLGEILQAQRDEEDICQGRPCKEAWMIENALLNQSLRTNNDYKMNE